jgi:hypothetical protein
VDEPEPRPRKRRQVGMRFFSKLITVMVAGITRCHIASAKKGDVWTQFYPLFDTG